MGDPYFPIFTIVIYFTFIKDAEQDIDLKGRWECSESSTRKRFYNTRNQ